MMHQRHTATTIDSRDHQQQHADSCLPSSLLASSGSSSDADCKSPKRKANRRRGSVRRSFHAYTQVGGSSSPISLLLLGCCGGIFLFACAVYIGVLLATTSTARGGGRHNGRNSGSRGTLHLDPNDPMHAIDDGFDLPFNSNYKVKEAIPTVGDRSDEYAALRKDIDPLLPDDPHRSRQLVEELQKLSFENAAMVGSPHPDTHHSDQIAADNNADTTDGGGSGNGSTDDYLTPPQASYDIYNCPDQPPQGYPYAWNILQILENWPPDDVRPRPKLYQGLCVFDYNTDYDKAMNYRKAELPFLVVNDPAVHKTVERWAQPGYMESMLGNEPHRCEFSENNHFMYYTPVSKKRRRMGKVPSGWKAPTKNSRMPYREWLKHANVTDDKLGPDQPHWYYRLIGCGLMGNDGSCDKGSSEYLFDELPFFQPKDGLYIVEPDEQKGIHCRFGMKGVIAENHFDGSRNAIAVLGGSRRYILAHPNQCEQLALYPKSHPSARHSAVDWSEPDLEQFPQFKRAMANEVVLQPGQVLYLPTNWFHYIVSLELNFQCNTRSGVGTEYMEPLAQCGF